MTVDDLGQRLVEHALLEGDFVLRSGKRSSWYLDKYRFETRPDLLRALGERLAEATAEVEPEAVRLAGPALGAVALAASASMASEVPFIIVRSETKEYGTANRIEGPFQRGELVCLVEDVVTSGGALAESVSALTRRRPRCPQRSVRRGPRGGRSRHPGAARRALARPLPRERSSHSAKSRRYTAWLSQNRRSVRVFVGLANDRLSGGEAVTKQEFVDAVAHKTSMSKRDAAAAVDAFLDTVEGALRAGDPVAFTGFGKFHVTHRAAREGVNPRNPTQKVHIPAANVPKFSAGSQLKKAVN